MTDFAPSTTLPDLDDEWYAAEDGHHAHETYESEADAFGGGFSAAATSRKPSQHHHLQAGSGGTAAKDKEIDVDLFYDSAVLPPFLLKTLASHNHGDGGEVVVGSLQATKEQDIRLPVKDPMSRMATWAKEGSEALRLFRREEQARKANLEATDTSKSIVNTLLRQNELKKGATVTEEEYEKLLRQARMERLRNATPEERAAIEAEERAAESKAMKEQGSMRDIERIGGAGGLFLRDGSNEAEKKRYYDTLREKLVPSRRRLPVYRCREALLDYIASNQVCVIEGETGSGKTTQLVQYLYEAGYTKDGAGIIGCTQPRKVAAVGVSKRVADEVGCELGTTVGYAVRLDNRSGPKTKIKFMTEGVLLREVIHDPDVKKYSVIVLDEAHERSIDTDVLLGVLKGVVRRRSDLKVIVTSATMNTQKFSDFFYGAKPFKIPGKVFPVDIVYEPPASLSKPDYIEDVVAKIMELHLDRHHLLAQIPSRNEPASKKGGGGKGEGDSVNDGAVLGDKRMREEGGTDEGGGGKDGDVEVEEMTEAEKTAEKEKAFAAALAKLIGDDDEAGGGQDLTAESAGLDILVFLPGKEEILSVISMVKAKLGERPKRFLDSLLLIPLYSELPPAQQLKALEPTPPGMRKCVVSTNVAETSLTIDGIRFVIDAGFMKTNVYRPAIGMNSLQTYPISQAEANQRKGRAGRTARGVCYRLYGEEQFEEEMLPSPVPEIQRSSIDSVVLLLKSIGVDNLMHFDFIDPPPEATIRDSCYKLWLLAALDADGKVTEEGLRMLEFPVEPSLAKMLIVSAKAQFKCSSEMLSIAAMISAETRSLFINPPGKEEQSRQERSKFNVANSDHLTLLNIFMQFDRSGKSRAWCKENYLDHRTLQRAVDIRAQFIDKMRATRLTVYPAARSVDEVSERIRYALVFGHISQIAKRIKWTEYESLQSGVLCAVSPASAIVEAGGASMPEYCIYNEFRQTTKEYMCLVSEVMPSWIITAAKGVIRPRGEPYDPTQYEALASSEDENKVRAVAVEEGEETTGARVAAMPMAGRGAGAAHNNPKTDHYAQHNQHYMDYSHNTYFNSHNPNNVSPHPNPNLGYYQSSATYSTAPITNFNFSNGLLPVPANILPMTAAAAPSTSPSTTSLAQSIREAALASASTGLAVSSAHPPQHASGKGVGGHAEAEHRAQSIASSVMTTATWATGAAASSTQALSTLGSAAAHGNNAPPPSGPEAPKANNKGSKPLSPLELAKLKMAASSKKKSIL